MEVACEHCRAKLKIPDEKVPKNQRVKINCPKCGDKIIFDTRQTGADPQRAPHPMDAHETGMFHMEVVETGTDVTQMGTTYGYDDYSEDEDLEFFEEESKLALVMTNDQGYAEKIMTAVEELGYKSITTSNTRDALGKMRFHHFDLIILTDGFDDQDLENSPVLNYMNHLSMSVRRQIFLTLVSVKLKTMDHMMAFSMSANAAVNTKDLDRLPAILKKAISDNQKFYKVFRETLVEIGKV